MTAKMESCGGDPQLLPQKQHNLTYQNSPLERDVVQHRNHTLYTKTEGITTIDTTFHRRQSGKRVPSLHLE